MTGPVVTSLSAASAQAGQQVTINGSGFGASQGNGYVAFSDNGTNWGSPGNTATFTIDSWSDTAITFTVPTPSGTNGEYHVWAGTPASVTVVDNSGDVSDSPELAITPTANPADYYDNAGISDDTNTVVRQLRRRRVQLLGAGPVGGRADPGRHRQRRRAHVHLAQRRVLRERQHPRRRADDAGQRNGRGEQARPARVVHERRRRSGPITITYTDGTSTTETLSSSDWANGPGATETAVATMTYRNMGSGGSQAITMYVYATTVPIDSSKTVASVTFPNVSNSVGSSTTAMHIFAVTTG